jgi:hypothetical protein
MVYCIILQLVMVYYYYIISYDIILQLVIVYCYYSRCEYVSFIKKAIKAG